MKEGREVCFIPYSVTMYCISRKEKSEEKEEER